MNNQTKELENTIKYNSKTKVKEKDLLYKVDDISHLAITHYNPLNVDCIEQSVSNNQFFKELESRFEISANEEMLIKECDELIKMTIDRVGH